MLLAGAFLLGALAQRLRQSPIVGYLLAGTIIGPLPFNARVVNQSAELGVSLLLFSIGLEFSFKRLREMGRMAFGGGTLQILATMGIVSGSLLLYLDPSQALTLGAVVALSSTAVVMRILVDRSDIDSIRGRSCLSILLMQDIAIVPPVLMVSLFSSAGISLGQVGEFSFVLTAAARTGGLVGGDTFLTWSFPPSSYCRSVPLQPPFWHLGKGRSGYSCGRRIGGRAHAGPSDRRFHAGEHRYPACLPAFRHAPSASDPSGRARRQGSIQLF